MMLMIAENNTITIADIVYHIQKVLTNQKIKISLNMTRLGIVTGNVQKIISYFTSFIISNFMGRFNNIPTGYIKGKPSKATTIAMLVLLLLGGSGCNTKDQSATQTSQEWKSTDGSQYEDRSVPKKPQEWKSPNPSKHEVRFDTIMSDGTYHINPYYLEMVKDTLLKYMTTFTQKDYDIWSQNPDMFFEFAKSDYDTLEQTIHTKLDISTKKQALIEARKKGDVAIVKQLEYDYATEILQEIYSYPANLTRLPNVSDIMSYKIACLEKTLLCHIYLEVLGISHSVAILPG